MMGTDHSGAPPGKRPDAAPRPPTPARTLHGDDLGSNLQRVFAGSLDQPLPSALASLLARLS
ncbi:NepR family anti-sigma factor [Sandarakinorhabdus sp.]|uniref:NepR family anti-sigma factor n=1 Tax=Sandarakinorhabdus sp. TaxID=1916663 RepID=UPI00286DA2FA|nr:NepR family anti-sigma factor [Sandarakinorhabdus sp.]